MPRTPKIRLDQAVVLKGLAPSRQQAQALIMAGKVLVDQHPADKPGTRISADALLELSGEPLRYASRGGLKLEAALAGFDLDVTGWVCLDVGASTGGFTDCLIQHGAGRVFAVDVGYGQLAWRLRQDPRVVVVERTNVRYMPAERVPEPVDLITIDVSFISLRIVVPAVMGLLREGGPIVALVKPQFEVGREKVGKGGVVRDAALHRSVIEELAAFFNAMALNCAGTLPSPVLGPRGNREFLMLLRNAGG